MPLSTRKLVLLVASLASLAALAVPPAATPARATTHVTLSSLEAGVLQQLNGIRVQHRLVPLRLSARLTASAAQHSEEMGTKGYFDHQSANGTAFWKRIARWYGSAHYHYWSVGENMLWSSPDIDPASALQIWMASPEHRHNILDPTWREIGISAVHFASAPGTYGGEPTTIVTTDFGVRH